MEQVESKSGFTALSKAACVGAPAAADAVCAAAALAGALDFAAGAGDFAGGLVVDSAASSSPAVAAVSTNIPSFTRILFL